MGFIKDSRNLIESLNTYLDQSILDEKPVINQRPLGKIIDKLKLKEHVGSMANLTALLAAHNHLDPGVRQSGNPGNLVILAPACSHYFIAKAGSTPSASKSVDFVRLDQSNSFI